MNATSLYLHPCTPLEIKQIVADLKIKSSYGYDKISNIILKSIMGDIINSICELFNTSMKEGIFPNIMKYADVIPLFKSGDREQLTNYHPISLLITVSKILEKLIYNRVYSFMDCSGQLYNSQYGFRTQHSCEQAITELVGKVFKGKNENKHTIAIFVDLSKAFDTKAHNILFLKMQRYGIQGVGLDWFKSYISDRPMRVHPLKNEPFDPDTYTKLNIGTPQGSCLGPLLFLLYCNDLYRNLELISCILFADDMTLYHSHTDMTYLNWCFENDLAIIGVRSRANKLSLNKN